MILCSKYVVDTNVPKVANLATAPMEETDIPLECILVCIEAIDYVKNKRALIIDAGDEIFTEYRKQLSMKGQPGLGDVFMKWVKDNRWTLPETNRIHLTPKENSYQQFPDDTRLAGFDPSDRKFVAVSNGHPEKPPILEATDSKWWGYKEILSELGIEIKFLCPEYVENKFYQKMGRH
jgi:hypothetical protein